MTQKDREREDVLKFIEKIAPGFLELLKDSDDGEKSEADDVMDGDNVDAERDHDGKKTIRTRPLSRTSASAAKMLLDRCRLFQTSLVRAAQLHQ